MALSWAICREKTLLAPNRKKLALPRSQLMPQDIANTFYANGKRESFVKVMAMSIFHSLKTTRWIFINIYYAEKIYPIYGEHVARESDLGFCYALDKVW